MNRIRKIFAEETPFILACPAVLWQILFLVLPILVLVAYSRFDAVHYHCTLAYYLQIFKSAYFKVIMHSFVMAGVTALTTLIIAYPVAYYVALKVRKTLRMFLLFSLILPSWTSLVVQAYAWFFLLDQRGFLVRVLQWIGMPASVKLLNNYFSIMVGMVAVYLPFMILPLFAVIERMDKRLIEASADLGASRYETFKRVILPLSLPGIYSGCLLVFIPAFGEFAIPTLLGGAKVVLWGNLIVEKFLLSRDWHSGAAFACFGVVFPLVVIGVIYAVGKIIAYCARLQRVRHEPYKDVW